MLSSVVGGRMRAEVVREVAALRQNEFHKTAAMFRSQFNLLIMEAATQNKKSVMLEVPLSYVGREPYDPVEMGKILVQQLREDGYVVTGTYLKFQASWIPSTTTARQLPAAKQNLINVPKPTKR